MFVPKAGVPPKAAPPEADPYQASDAPEAVKAAGVSFWQYIIVEAGTVGADEIDRTTTLIPTRELSQPLTICDTKYVAEEPVLGVGLLAEAAPPEAFVPYQRRLLPVAASGAALSFRQ